MKESGGGLPIQIGLKDVQKIWGFALLSRLQDFHGHICTATTTGGGASQQLHVLQRFCARFGGILDVFFGYTLANTNVHRD